MEHSECFRIPVAAGVIAAVRVHPDRLVKILL